MFTNMQHCRKSLMHLCTTATNAEECAAAVSTQHYMVICSTICVGFIGTFRAFTSFAGGSNFCSSDLRFWIARSSFELLQDLLHCSTSYTHEDSNCWTTAQHDIKLYPPKLVRLQSRFEVSSTLSNFKSALKSHLFTWLFSRLHQQLWSVTAPLNRFYVLWRHRNHRCIIIIIIIFFIPSVSIFPREFKN